MILRMTKTKKWKRYKFNDNCQQEYDDTITGDKLAQEMENRNNKKLINQT